jgi:DNA mismatch repair protein MutL
MGKIRELSPEIISKIAAGEVIERPCFAIKELIENSIDAGANDIRVEIEQAGLKKIQVIDNGEGMDEVDLKNCFLPHTTSKLKDDSLTAIGTLGFRGEALSAIAAVSDIKIISRQKETDFGSSVEVSKGKLLGIVKVGAPVGTSVTLENLFASVPARKKFLKSERTEFRHILDTIIHFALSYPRIRFEVYHNGKLIFDLLNNQSLIDRIKLLLGPSVYENMIPLNYEESYLKISGFLCKPQLATTNSSRQHLFVNNRHVLDNLISGAIKTAYGTMLESQTFPVFILFISLPKEIVDVNVHPRKELISFSDNQFIYNTIHTATCKTLSDHNLTFLNLSWVGKSSHGNTNSYLAKMLKREILPWENETGVFDFTKTIQIHNLYLLCPSKKGILLIDQHAADERILYEKFTHEFLNQKNKREIYPLPQALLLDLSPVDAQTLLENLDTFADLGFLIESFGQNSFKIESVPAIFQDWDIISIIREILDDLIQFGSPKDITIKVQKMLSYLACRAAIKSGDKLTDQQAIDLIKELSGLDLAYTCPHGRPLKIEISLKEIDHLFKRR